MSAIKAHAVSARSNPYLWDSVAALCEMGVNLRTENLFRPLQTDPNDHTYDPFAEAAQPQQLQLSNASRILRNGQSQQNNRGVGTGLAATTAIAKTPVMKSSAVSLMTDDGFSTPSDIREAKKPYAALPLAPQKRPATRNATFDIKPPPSFDSLLTISGKSASTKRPGSGRSLGGAHGNVLLSTNKPKIARAKTDGGSSKRDGDHYIVHLFRTLTEAYKMFCSYQFQAALHWFGQLPNCQKETPWAIGKLGRTYFEMVDYRTAETYFKHLRTIARCRIEDMEYYSTLLWHLKKDVELSFLSHELLGIDRNSWQAWCALGNSFSVQKDTDQALQCFHRAIQLAPECPYAYTLQGHEHCENDAYEKAQESFRLAIRANNRHYNAWYGLGMVFHRLGNLDLAEHHYLKASTINPSNAVVICCIGGILEQSGRLTEALELYKKACDIQPKSASARFKKARALVDLKLYNAALVEFDHLRSLAPDEAKVHFLLGTLYKLLDNRDLAVKHLTIALNLDPKGAHVIKETLEGLGSASNPA
jgi:anaphase-promoting complex subunit 3